MVSNASLADKVQLHPLLAGLSQVVEDLVKAIGIPCEIVIHDLADPSSSIVAIEGGITERIVGGPTTDFVLRLLRSRRTDENLIAYPNKTADGRPLRSSTLFVRDDSGQVIGCLCINIDLTYWNVLSSLVDKLCDTTTMAEAAKEAAEFFHLNVTDLLREAVETAIARHDAPVPLMERSEKLEIVRWLETDGIFLIRGSVDYVADALGVSRPTIYNYLAESRSVQRLFRTSQHAELFPDDS